MNLPAAPAPPAQSTPIPTGANLTSPKAAHTDATAQLAQALCDALPQTQCTRCGYPDCAAYALAMASGQADINQCPPGGQAGIVRLAKVLGRSTTNLPDLSAAHGQEGPRHMALIDEATCIGCTLCIAACPTDAIMGASKRMHTVIAPACTGCGLCLPVCPVDCIAFDSVTPERTGWAAWSQPQADTARQRYQGRLARLSPPPRISSQQLDPDSPAASRAPPPATDLAQPERKQAILQAAMAKAKRQAT